MKKIIVLLFPFMICSSICAQILTVSAGNRSAIVGDSVTIPIDVTGFSNVGAITIVVKYDSSTLSWGRAINWNNEVAGALAGGGNGKITIAWDNATDPANISSGKLLELKFLYHGGTCDISFVPDEITDIEGNPFQVSYSPGSVDEYHIEAPSYLGGLSLEVGKVNLKWRDNSYDETGFIIERADSGSDNFSEIGDVIYNVCRFVDNNVYENQIYRYRVKAYNVNSQSYFSNSITVLTPISTVTPPSNLQVEPDTSGNFCVKWMDNSNNELGFIIERFSNDSSKGLTKHARNVTRSINLFIDTLEANITSYIDRTVQEGQTYEYRVFGFNGDGISPILADTSISPVMPLIAPGNFLIKVEAPNKIVLTWQDNSQYEKGFRIERSTVQDSGYNFIEAVETNITQYIDTLFESKTKYHYRIAAFNESGISAFVKNNIVVGIDRTEKQIPADFKIFQNYPNPFNPLTTLNYSLPEESRVSIIVYNTIGEIVATLINTVQQVGYYETTFDGSSMTSGIYFYELIANDPSSQNVKYRQVCKMMLIK